MPQPKLQTTGRGSFYGDYLYENIVPRDHFLRHMRELVPWQRYTYRLLKFYRGKGEVGRPLIDPAVVLKMLPVSYLYGLSERAEEGVCSLNLTAKHFLGLAVDARAPDHSTLTASKNRILENGKLRAYERMLERIIKEARQAGITFGPIQLVDSTHSVADVNVAKDDRRQDKGEEPRDPDARWGCKGTYAVADEEGKKQKRKKLSYGFKMHTSMNADSQMITSVVVSTGNRPDRHCLRLLIQRDLDQGIPVEVCGAERGCDAEQRNERQPYRHFGLQVEEPQQGFVLRDRADGTRDPGQPTPSKRDH